MIIEDFDLKKIMYNHVKEGEEFYEDSNEPRFTLIELKPTLFVYNKPGTNTIEHLEY